MAAAKALQDLDRFLEQEPMRFEEALQHFKRLLTEMTRDERELSLFNEICELYYGRILLTHLRERSTHDITEQELVDAFVDSLRIMLADGGNDSSLLCDFFLMLLSPARLTTEYFLQCVSGESWWDIRVRKLLMEDMQFSRPRCIELLKYGFPYSFDVRYFNSRCLKIHTGFQIKGESLPREVIANIFRSVGTLRLQMALEILTAVFNEDGSMGREILGLLWKTVPHPFISSTEMFRLMAPFFANFPQKLRDLCQEYPKRNTVFEVPRVTVPRSLLHQSRVQVRRNLLDAKKLNDGTIDGLYIPRVLKGYLKLDFF